MSKKEKKSWKEKHYGKFIIDTLSGLVANILLAILILLIGTYNGNL